MRIIGGDARGRTLVAPAGEKTRPTQDYVRESLFNIIRWDVEDARVLDLFAARCWWIRTGRPARPLRETWRPHGWAKNAA